MKQSLHISQKIEPLNTGSLKGITLLLSCVTQTHNAVTHISQSTTRIKTNANGIGLLQMSNNILQIMQLHVLETEKLI